MGHGSILAKNLTYTEKDLFRAMKYTGTLKPDTLVSLANWITVPLFFVYFFAMLITPWSKGDWHYVQNVWDRWQTLNAGLLAFAASVIALNISRYNENKQRQRRFIAARAFLPHALSELTAYNKKSSALLREALQGMASARGTITSPLKSEPPDLPESYKEVFSKCISEADQDVGDYLAKIIVKLQRHQSRMTALQSSFGHDSHQSRDIPYDFNTYMYRLGELQALINRIFEYSTSGRDSFNDSDLAWEDYRNSYANLNIEVDDIDGLEEFTQRRIAKDCNSTD